MRSLFIAAILLFSLSITSCAQVKQVASANTPVNSSGNTFEDDVLELVNRYRHTKKLPPLKLHPLVITEARKHSYQMSEKMVEFGHAGFQSRSKSLEGKIVGLRSVAENVAFGQKTAKEVVEDWLNSPGHKKNIEGNYTHTGIGIVANKKGVLYYTQIFVR